MLFKQARFFTRVTSPARSIDLVVLHTMEYPERPTGAEWCADFFAGPSSPRASCHYAIDADSVVQCVRDEDVAWAAPDANHNGLQLEHAGYASQTKLLWGDLYSRAMLERSAALTARLCVKHRIPVRFVDSVGLRIGVRGITTHNAVTQAFPGPGRTHWDPGPNFPMDEYIALVKKNMPEPSTRTPMPAAFWLWARWRLGEGEFRALGPKSSPRPKGLPYVIPLTWWARLRALLKARNG
jgi:N-acetyl-anhydromuramyl-L-alanine amidase AmpD